MKINQILEGSLHACSSALKQFLHPSETLEKKVCTLLLDFVQDTEKFLQETEMPRSVATNAKVTLGLDGR